LARLYRRRIVRSIHINAVLADAVLAVVREAREAIPAIPAIPAGSEKIPEKRYSFFETPEFRVQAYPYPYPSSGSASIGRIGRIGRIGLIGLQLVCIGDTAVLGTTMEETVATHARALAFTSDPAFAIHAARLMAYASADASSTKTATTAAVQRVWSIAAGLLYGQDILQGLKAEQANLFLSFEPLITDRESYPLLPRFRPLMLRAIANSPKYQSGDLQLYAEHATHTFAAMSARTGVFVPLCRATRRTSFSGSEVESDSDSDSDSDPDPDPDPELPTQ
jgi:hypothetical protein